MQPPTSLTMAAGPHGLHNNHSRVVYNYDSVITIGVFSAIVSAHTDSLQLE